MIRRLFAIASALSLVCSATALVVWAESYVVDRSIELARRGRVYEFRASRGVLTATNGPQLRMENALLKQRSDASRRVFYWNENRDERKPGRVQWASPRLVGAPGDQVRLASNASGLR